MHSLLNAQPLSERPNHATYVDDVHVGGQGLADTWRDTLEAIRCLTRGGFLLNAWKLQLLMRTLTVLGYVVSRDRFSLGSKALGKLLGGRLPRSDRELL